MEHTMRYRLLDEKAWLPQGLSPSDLHDSDFAWIADACKTGDQAKVDGRRFAFAVHGKVSSEGWKAAWSAVHQENVSFDGGPDRKAVITLLLKRKPADVPLPESRPTVKAARGIPGDLEYKTFSFAIKAADASSSDLNEGEFEGYAAAFGNVDSCGDIIEKGAFARYLAEYLADGTVCWQHDWTEPIGKPLDAREDDPGLYIKGRISKTTRGSDALILLRDGVVAKMSIGYRATGWKVLSDEQGRELLGDEAYEEALRNLPWWMDGVRVITEIKLYEVSLVTVPANTGATITAVKESPLAGQTLDDHFQAVHAAAGEFLARVKAVADLRAKSGRVLSAANQSRLQTMRDSLADHLDTLDDLLAQASPNDPDGDGDDDAGTGNDPDRDDAEKGQSPADEARKAYLRFVQTKLQARSA